MVRTSPSHVAFPSPTSQVPSRKSIPRLCSLSQAAYVTGISENRIVCCLLTWCKPTLAKQFSQKPKKPDSLGRRTSLVQLLFSSLLSSIDSCPQCHPKLSSLKWRHWLPQSWTSCFRHGKSRYKTKIQVTRHNLVLVRYASLQGAECHKWLCMRTFRAPVKIIET